MWRRYTGEKGHEEGAVAILVALCLVAVMAMVVLTVDVGALLLRRRAMVNGADAAALAAAKSCFGVEDSDVPGDLADQYAVENSTGLTKDDGGIVQGETHNCDNGKSGHVTVEYHQSESLYFAPVLGLNDSGDVTTKATASWGATGAAPPIPLVLNAGALQGPCEIPDVPEGTTCRLWYDNNLFGGSAFGFLDVKYPGGWDVVEDDSCNNSGGADQLRDWINGTDSVGTLHLNYPNHTFVCVDGGIRGQVSTSVWGEITKLIGQTRDFPINGLSPADGDTQVLKNGLVDKYNIIGFAQMEIVDVLDAAEAGGTPGQDGTCAKQSSPAMSGGSTGRFFPWSDLGNSGGCPGSTVPDAVDTLVLGTLRPGTDYTATNTGFTLNANVTLPNHSAVSFNWHVYPVPGACGDTPPPNASSRCLIVKWNGSTLGGEEPGGGANFGYGGIRLCELSYESCIDQSSP